jgi:hypothetical protein
LSSSPLGRFCAGEEESFDLGLVGAGGWEQPDPAGESDGNGPEAQALLEGLVAALEVRLLPSSEPGLRNEDFCELTDEPSSATQLFTYQQSRPFPASNSSLSDLPMPTFTPIPNTTPLNLPPLPSSAATSPYPGRGTAAPPAKTRGAVERHLLLISDGGLRLPSKGDEVRWNGEARFDGTTWATVGRAVGGLEIRTSVILLGESAGGAADKPQPQPVDSKLLALVTPVSTISGRHRSWQSICTLTDRADVSVHRVASLPAQPGSRPAKPTRFSFLLRWRPRCRRQDRQSGRSPRRPSARMLPPSASGSLQPRSPPASAQTAAPRSR